MIKLKKSYFESLALNLTGAIQVHNNLKYYPKLEFKVEILDSAKYLFYLHIKFLYPISEVGELFIVIKGFNFKVYRACFKGKFIGISDKFYKEQKYSSLFLFLVDLIGFNLITKQGRIQLMRKIPHIFDELDI